MQKSMDKEIPYLISSVQWKETDGTLRRRITVDIPDSLTDTFFESWKTSVEHFEKVKPSK